MSSYLALRCIERDDMDFFEGMAHENIKLTPDRDKISVRTAEDIDRVLKSKFEKLKNEKLGIFLSGGMDSAILASYMPNCDAYTFRFLDGNFQTEELERAAYYAKCYGLRLHYIDINWQTIENYLNRVMATKCAPVHSIEPQLLQGALQAQKDGISLLVLGEGSDSAFGGLDQLLAKDWTFNDFMKRYMFTDPKAVLNNPVDMQYVFEKYRDGEKIDFLRFIKEIFAMESGGSYYNAFRTANMPYFAPYTDLKMTEPLDLKRVRNGESKYIIRELFTMKYPNIPVPDKIPMPRPVDYYFKNWQGPTRPEFKPNLDMSKFTGNQKWQLFCLERFLNIYDKSI